MVERALKSFPETIFILADPSSEMLKEAKKKLSGAPESRVTFLATVTQDFSAEKIGSVDVVTAIQSHHYLQRDKRVKATKVCYDLLKPGGIYVTFENTRPATEAGIKIGKRSWKDHQIKSCRNIETVESHLKRFDTIFFPITVEEHLSLLKKTGFRTAELLWYSRMQAGFYGIK
jgi:tRNA (cmo5U34)-methyltransferase